MKHIVLGKEIAVEKISYDNPYRFDQLHRHKYFEFLLFDIGLGGKQIVDFIEYENSSKSLFLITPGQVHLMKRLPKENGILIQFNKNALNQAISPLKINYFFRVLLNTKIELSEDQYHTISLLFQSIKKVHDSNTALRHHKLIRLLGFILFEIFEISSKNVESFHIDNIAYQFLNMAQESIKTMKSVQEYAKLLNVSTTKLTKKVSMHIGKSPLQVIHDILLTEIKRLMIVEQLSHKEIAFELNFDSQSSYSRFIKKHTTLSPSNLKKELGQIAQ